MRWRTDFARTYLERDLRQMGFDLPAETMRRLWTMCAHQQGQILNSLALGSALGLSHHTIRRYIDLLARTFMLRILPPFAANVKILF